MSGRKKGGGGYTTKSERLSAMARKREERMVRKAYRNEQKMESYLQDDDNFGSFSNQLAKMGLQLRDIPGDGNCLFRALGDQLQGHIRDHYKHRLMVVKFMQEHRADFEPFVEDDVPFDRHMQNLKKPGTYAGNDAIVAFARLNEVNIVIHQLNSPVWTIKGIDKPNTKELHISYHNGDHYSSVRKLGDTAEAPANIKFMGDGEKVKFEGPMGDEELPQNSHNHYYEEGAATYTFPPSSPGYDSDYDNVPSYAPNVNRETVGVARAYRGLDDVEETVMRATGCTDATLVRQTLEEVLYDAESAIDMILSLMHASSAANGHVGPEDCTSVSSQHTADSGIWSDNGTANRIFGNGSGTSGKGAKPKDKKLSTKEKNKQKKLQKQLRTQERHRLKMIGASAPADYDDDDPSETVISNGMGSLHI